MTSAPARAVFITPVLPMKTGMGLAMRAAVQLDALMRVFDVTVLLVPIVEAGHGVTRFREAFPRARLEVISEPGETDAYFKLISRLRDPAEQLAHFSRYGKPSLAAHVSDRVRKEVAEHVHHHGAAFAHVFRAYLATALDEVPGHVMRSIDLDEDDAASCLSSAMLLAAQGKSMAARWAGLEATYYDRLLAQTLASFRSVTLANADDLGHFASRHPGVPLRARPNGVPVPNLNLIPPPGPARGQTILFVGSLRYAPNVDGLLWFIRKVFPRLRGARLRIAGRAPPAVLLAHARAGRVEFLGYVEDMSSAYREAALAIAPMRSGGGTRIKILEAAAHGVPVVATTAAAAGLWTSAPAWGIAADDDHGFSMACRRLLANPREALRLGRRGRQAVMRRYGHENVMQEWTQLFNALQGTDNGGHFGN